MFNESITAPSSCPRCGKPAARTYCSAACYHSRAPRVARTCVSCGVTFYLKQSDARRRSRTHCSHKCRSQHCYNIGKYSPEEAMQRWWKRVGEVPEMWARAALRSARKKAKQKGIEFSLSINDLLPLPQVCPLLNTRLNYAKGKGKGGSKADSPSLDRIYNTRGYVPGNVWIVCYRANTIKNDATLQELQAITSALALALGVGMLE